MVNINILSYDESDDSFKVSVADHSTNVGYDSVIPAFLMPYIAPELCAAAEELPFDLVNQSFSLTSPLVS